jgi:ATP-dependent DNA ligase
MSARGPIEVQLAKAQDSVPPKSALVGGTIWELKYDGYRAPVRVTGQGAELWSRNGSNLSSHFPDLVAAAEAQLAAGVVLDGEAVVWLDGRLNFDQLQRRMVSRPAVAAKLAREHPASYVAFDLLTLGEQDLRPHPWRDRRAALEDLASTWRPPLQLSPIPTTTTPPSNGWSTTGWPGSKAWSQRAPAPPTVPAAETGSK